MSAVIRFKVFLFVSMISGAWVERERQYQRSDAKHDSHWGCLAKQSKQIESQEKTLSISSGLK